MPIISLRTLNTVTVTLALGLVALAGWHVQNPGHFEQIQVFNPSCAIFVLWRPLPRVARGLHMPAGSTALVPCAR